MTAKYLLPCPCGRKVAIDVGQSGQTVACQCGRRLDAPTMLKIRALERVEEEIPQCARRPWGVRQRLILLGGLIAAVAGCAALGLYLTRPPAPKPPDLEWVQAVVEHFSLAQTFVEWGELRGGLNRESPVMAGYAQARAANLRWIAVAAVVGVLGVACAASSLLVPASK